MRSIVRITSGWWRGLALSVLAQTAASQAEDPGARGRAELAAAVEEARAGAAEPTEVALEPSEAAFGIAFTAVESRGFRVLATSGADEAREAARMLTASRALFQKLTKSETTHPTGLRAFLLGTEDTRSVFLAKHPKLSPETRERWLKLEGAGVPGTADWVVWGGDAEKRVDAVVRFSLDWLFRARGVTTERHAWLHEGLGFYLTHALVGTRQLWFVRPMLGTAKRDADNLGLLAQMEEPGADWIALADGVFDPEQKFDLEELLHLAPQELDPKDHLRVHALAAYVVEVHPAALPDLVARVGADEDPRVVLQELLGMPFGELRGTLDAWVGGYAAMRARTLGLRSDAELLAQWEALAPAQERAFVPALQERVDALDTQQLRWLRAALARAPDPIPRAEELPYFDPKTHAPADPIPRKRLGASDSRVKRLLKELRGDADPTAPVLAYDYDWGKARVVRTGNPDDPADVFHNARLGLPPGADIARAVALWQLDHADERKLQAAFSHAYTDRDGRVFPVPLFEMWATGATMEMPDVDALGIVHTVVDEWGRWVAPVPPTQHQGLYKVIGDLFTACRRSRELRLTLADLYLAPSATARKGYESLTLNLHVLWAEHESDGLRLGPALPDAKGYEPFLAGLVQRCQQDYALYGRGRRRASQLRKDQEALRIVLGAALDEAAATPVTPETPAGESGGR